MLVRIAEQGRWEHVGRDPEVIVGDAQGLCTFQAILEKVDIVFLKERGWTARALLNAQLSGECLKLAGLKGAVVSRIYLLLHRVLLLPLFVYSSVGCERGAPPLRLVPLRPGGCPQGDAWSFTFVWLAAKRKAQ